MSSRTNMIKMGKHIADLRKSKNYTQKTLGDILDVSDKTISKWEKGVVAPDITILQSLANVLDVSVEEILAGEEVKNINTIEALDIYSNMTKNKLIKSFIIFTLLFAILVFFVFRIEEYYSWKLDPLYSEGEASLKGYLLNNNKESKIVINKIYLPKENITFNLKTINLTINNKNKTIYNEKSEFDKPVDLNNFLNNYIINVESSKVIKKKNLSINFIVQDDIGRKKTYLFEFK